MSRAGSLATVRCGLLPLSDSDGAEVQLRKIVFARTDTVSFGHTFGETTLRASEV